MTINERMNHIIKELYGGNKRAFANAIGVSATVIENVVGTRQGKPSYDVLEKVCANANISAEWLLMERGEMLYNSTSQTQYTPPDQNTHYFIENRRTSRGNRQIKRTSKIIVYTTIGCTRCNMYRCRIIFWKKCPKY